MNRFLRMLMLGLLTVSLSAFGFACNTTEGVGEDIEDVGEEMEDAVD